MIDMPGVPGFLDGNRYLLTGFEDQNRVVGSDNDFNDLVYVLQATPFTAVTVENVFTFAPGDPDGDGVTGVADHFPNDPRRARVARTPSTGITMVGLEDEYPAVGDSDYNDCVVGYAFEVVSNAQGGITDILATFHLLARGSVHNHGVGLHLPGLPTGTTGTLQIERFLSDAYASHQVVSRSLTDLIDRDWRRIADVFPYTMQALPATASPQTIANTDAMAPGRPAASARVALRFDVAVPADALGLPPYDLWFQIHRGGLRDVHFPGRSAFAERQAGLPAESGAGSFRDANGYPFLLEIPNTWRFPLERVRIDAAYPQFAQWRNSAGAQARSWYLLPTSTANRVSNAIDQYVPQRDWTVLLPPQ